MKKRILKLILSLAVACIVQLGGEYPIAQIYAGDLSKSGETVQYKQPPKNIILISWDGVQRNHLRELLSTQTTTTIRLPNLIELAKRGTLVEIDVTHKTDTKAGHAQLLTGYEGNDTSVHGNKNYGEIPDGYTLFERLKAHFGATFTTIMITGKKKHLSIEEGGPFHNAAGDIDILDVEDRPWFLSLSVMLNALEIAGPPGPGAHYDPFFAFLHFADPDIAGHYRGDKIDYTYYGDTENIAPNVLANWIYHFEGTLPHGGENSKLYEMAIKKCDDCLGEIVAKLEELGIRDETEIYVTSDHGFDEEGATYPINSLFPDRIGHTHIMAPYVFLATDDPTVIRAGNQFDIAPTILKRFGIDISVYGTEKCTCPYCMYPDPNGPERCPRFPGKSLSEPKPAWTWDKWRP